MRFNIEIYVNGKLSSIIPNITQAKVDQYIKTLSVQNGSYKVVKIK